jgi:hypothetical protein
MQVHRDPVENLQRKHRLNLEHGKRDGRMTGKLPWSGWENQAAAMSQRIHPLSSCPSPPVQTSKSKCKEGTTDTRRKPSFLGYQPSLRKLDPSDGHILF